jgi:hypothetical protein
MYTQFLTQEEINSLVRDYTGVGHTPIIHLSLVNFAMQSRTIEGMKQIIDNYVKWIDGCDCWHCNHMRLRLNTVGISGYDAWLRLLLSLNGLLVAQLN